MADYEYAIGPSVVGLQNLEDDLGIPPPHPAPFREWSKSYSAGDGLVHGDGFPSADWHWDYLSATHVAALHAYCAGKSATVYIRTLQADFTTWANYYGVVIWPTMPEEAEFRMGGASTNFVLKLRRLEIQ